MRLRDSTGIIVVGVRRSGGRCGCQCQCQWLPCLVPIWIIFATRSQVNQPTRSLTCTVHTLTTSPSLYLCSLPTHAHTPTHPHPPTPHAERDGNICNTGCDHRAGTTAESRGRPASAPSSKVSRWIPRALRVVPLPCRSARCLADFSPSEPQVRAPWFAQVGPRACRRRSSPRSHYRRHTLPCIMHHLASPPFVDLSRRWDAVASAYRVSV